MEVCAFLECSCMNSGHCIGQMHSLKVCAVFKGADIDCFQAVIQCFIACNIRETEIGQAHTPFKSILAD